MCTSVANKHLEADQIFSLDFYILKPNYIYHGDHSE